MANVIGNAANTVVDVALAPVDVAIAGLKAVTDAAEAEAHEAVSVAGKGKDAVLAEIVTQRGILENLMRGLADAAGNLGS